MLPWQKIQWLILDIDGVLTNGQLHYTEQGEHFKSFHVHDGYGIRLCLQANIQVAIISAKANDICKKRLLDLKIKHIMLGADDKKQAFASLCATTDCKPEHALYMGDDMLDMPVMDSVLIACAPNNAHPKIQNHRTLCY